MTRWDAKVDQNQREIVQALRDIGATVWLTHRLGSGFPDLTVGFREETYLLEVKTEHGVLSPSEQDFFDEWRGHAAVVRSVDDALIAIGAMEIPEPEEIMEDWEFMGIDPTDPGGHG